MTSLFKYVAATIFASIMVASIVALMLMPFAVIAWCIKAIAELIGAAL